MRTPRLILLASFAVVVFASTNRLFAQNCPETPLFDLGGPACSSSRQNAPCGCSECLLWDPSTGAGWYEIHRCDAGGGACVVTGDTRFRNRPGLQPTVWCVAWDSPFPVVGAPYDYTVRACKDGPTGPICATGLSNPVRYVGAPYMCIENGLEVACVSSSTPANGDNDGDGLTDAVDPDDDHDGLLDIVDNCPQRVNFGQRDRDGDGIGDPCDPEPLWTTPGGADTDGDGIADRLDDCPSTHDPGQSDVDGDRSGDVCDNCPAGFNEQQSDADADGEGDVCDLDDGLITAGWTSRTRLNWDHEGGASVWSVYRGDLAELRRSRTYTQQPGSNPLAARWCGFTVTWIDDPAIPAVGTAAFYVLGAGAGNVGIGLGLDGTGEMRPNTRPCP